MSFHSGPRGAEDIVAFFEFIRGFFENDMPADGLHPLPDFAPGRVRQFPAPEKDSPEAEIDQLRPTARPAVAA